MLEERIEVSGIPAKLYLPDDARGLLLLGHGGAHSKDGSRFVRLSRWHAERTGLAVVCIDAIDHGERSQPSVGGPIPKEWHSSNADQMVDDWRTTVASLSSIGPAVAYVGFSMGVIFGLPTVAAMPTIRAAVFVAGGIPTGGGIVDEPLRLLLLTSASQLTHASVLMLNKTGDEIFSVADSETLFDRIPGEHNRLRFSDGPHDDWPDEMIEESLQFIEALAPADPRTATDQAEPAPGN